MVFIYVLGLEDGKYYIGKTNNPEIRIESHFFESGSEWTKKYKPIEIVEIKENCDDYDEDKITRIYMDKYGIDNVRGGSFSQVNLDENTIKTLTSMSRGTNNECYKCGSKDHFLKDCPKNQSILAKIWNALTKSDSEESTTESCDSSSESDNVCYRCGRHNHYANSCFAKMHIKGYSLKK